jgi:hypothetical protein
MTVLDGYSPADRQKVAMLAQFAVSKLWEASPDSLPGDPDRHGCCPVHCGPCSVLAALDAEGTLNQWLRYSEEPLTGTAWWIDALQEVDRDWLFRAWDGADKHCHPERAYEK